MCFNEYYECKTFRILRTEADKNRYPFFPDEEALHSEYQSFNNNKPLMGEFGDKKLSETGRKNQRSSKRWRLIISPEYVSTLDESDGSKQYDEQP